MSNDSEALQIIIMSLSEIVESLDVINDRIKRIEVKLLDKMPTIEGEFIDHWEPIIKQWLEKNNLTEVKASSIFYDCIYEEAVKYSNHTSNHVVYYRIDKILKKLGWIKKRAETGEIYYEKNVD